MAITIKEIAVLAGTSRGTVDRVFNNRGKVNKSLADKIIKIAKENNYTPNTMAKMLVASQNKVTIGVVINSVGNLFFEEVLKGIESARKEWSNNIEIEMIKLEGFDGEDQVKAIDKLVSKGVNAIAITPVDSEEVVDKLNALAKKDILVAFINTYLDGVEYFISAGSNSTQSGKMAGSITAMSLNPNSKIAIVTGSYKNSTNKKRVVGFSEVIRESDKNLQIVEVLENRDNDDYSKEVVKKLLEKRKEIDLIYFCAGGIKGGLQAIEESETQIKAITVDTGRTIRKHLEEGSAIATITQDPFKQGYIPIEKLVKFFVFGEIPTKKKIHIENKIVVKYNMNS